MAVITRALAASTGHKHSDLEFPKKIRKNPNKTVKSGTEYGIQSIRPALKRLERDPAKKTRKKSNHISPGTESAAGRRPETRSPPTAESSFP